jgi:hypothetical protein
MRRTGTMWSVLSAFVLLVSVSTARAQRNIPGIEVTVGDWAFTPTLYDGALETLLALRTDTVPAGSITSVWFLKGASGTWSAWGWTDPDHAKTTGYVKTALETSEADDRNLRVAPSPVDPNELPPGAFDNGRFTDNPFEAENISLADPNDVEDFFVTIGWVRLRTVAIGRCIQFQPWLEAIDEVVADELAVPGSATFDLSDSTVCQGGGGGGITCTPRTVTSSFITCTSTGWGAPTSTPQPLAGGCMVENSWSASVTYTETRRTRFIYSNCTSCLQTETRTRTCTAYLAEVDLAGPVFQCGTGIPAGYTPPPASTTPCSLPSANCIGGWGPWTIVGAPCAALW